MLLKVCLCVQGCSGQCFCTCFLIKTMFDGLLSNHFHLTTSCEVWPFNRKMWMGQMEMLQLMKSNKLKKHIVWNIVIKLPFSYIFLFQHEHGVCYNFQKLLVFQLSKTLGPCWRPAQDFPLMKSEELVHFCACSCHNHHTARQAALWHWPWH